MTGPEHYREAEASIEAAWDRDTDDSRRMLLLADAQAHATLAVAAATVDARRGGCDVWQEWPAPVEPPPPNPNDPWASQP